MSYILYFLKEYKPQFETIFIIVKIIAGILAIILIFNNRKEFKSIIYSKKIKSITCFYEKLLILINNLYIELKDNAELLMISKSTKDENRIYNMNELLKQIEELITCSDEIFPLSTDIMEDLKFLSQFVYRRLKLNESVEKENLEKEHAKIKKVLENLSTNITSEINKMVI
jgi:predicted signal transduction protein with EAL and GGDEF domain